MPTSTKSQKLRGSSGLGRGPAGGGLDSGGREDKKGPKPKTPSKASNARLDQRLANLQRPGFPRAGELWGLGVDGGGGASNTRLDQRLANLHPPGFPRAGGWSRSLHKERPWA